MIVDCHVNIWNDEDVLPHYHTQLGRVRERLIGAKADADTLYREMEKVDKAIVFALSYADTSGIDSSDETTVAAVAKYPDKFVGFAYLDPRRPDFMERLRHASSSPMRARIAARWGAIRGPQIVMSECVRCDDCERLYADTAKCPHWIILRQRPTPARTAP